MLSTVLCRGNGPAACGAFVVWEAKGVVGELMGEPCAPKETWKCAFLGLGLFGGEMAVVLCSGLGAGFRNLEEERDEDQHLKDVWNDSVVRAVVAHGQGSR